MARVRTGIGDFVSFALLVVTLGGLYVTSSHSYLLFHSLVEIFSVVIASGIFMIAWHSRHFTDNHYILLIGISHLFVAILELLHALTYPAMGIFPNSDANISAQFWLVARSLQSVALLAAPLFLTRPLPVGPTVGGCLLVTVAATGAISHGGIIPDCLRAGGGLTPFKVGSEYVICLVLSGAFVLMIRQRRFLDRKVIWLMGSALLLFIAGEVEFSRYRRPFGVTNMIGHLFALSGYYFIYRAMIGTMLEKPYNLLFRNLKESEERYRNLYNNTPAMLHSIDQAGRIVSVSDYWLETLGYRRDEVVGRLSADFMTDDSRSYVLGTIIPQFLETGRIREAPLQVVARDGRTIDVLLSSEAERDVRGEIVRSLSVMTDISEQRHSAREVESLNASLAARAMDLELANSDLEAFNYTVSHDLRSHLTVIAGYSDVLLTVCAGQLSDECREYVGRIEEESRRMNGLIETLLGFSRVARHELRRETVDLSRLAEDISFALRMNEPERPATFAIAGGMTTHADAALLRIVLENLLGNAWKYTRKKATAEIAVGREDVEGKPIFFVKDNGAGFPMEFADRLFCPFQRLHDKADYPGHGIGLATAQRIVNRHGGAIWAVAEPDRGATFFFTLE